ncbi:hypothetical protein [Paraburkholderia youngii]|uniref:hypothetical protein n=1 Tax=Paraburkholderia sp. BR10954 TaxID=3236995 RepID=UPI001595875A|nr:hypothetical protein [Paraburkholderia youngii]
MARPTGALFRRNDAHLAQSSIDRSNAPWSAGSWKNATKLACSPFAMRSEQSLPLSGGRDAVQIIAITARASTTPVKTNPSSNAHHAAMDRREAADSERRHHAALRPALWRQLGLAFRAGTVERPTQYVLDVLRSLRLS